MCPLCISATATLAWSGGSAGGAALALGYWARKKRLFKAMISRTAADRSSRQRLAPLPPLP